MGYGRILFRAGRSGPTEAGGSSLVRPASTSGLFSYPPDVAYDFDVSDDCISFFAGAPVPELRLDSKLP
jgi:hypothetical protein